MIPEDAYGEIQMLLSRLPDSAGTIVMKSREFRDFGDVDFAYELIKKALARDSAPVLRLEHADILCVDGRFAEAAQEAMFALHHDFSSSHAKEIIVRALTLGLPDTLERLRDIAHTVIKEAPDLTERLFRSAADELEDIVMFEELAHFYATRGKVEECVSELEMILAIDPDHDDARMMLTAALIKLGDFHRAQELIRTARQRGITSEALDALEAKVAEVMSVIHSTKR